MELLAKKKTKRISVWVLVFALLFTVVSASLILPAHATGGMMSDVGEAVSDVGEGVGEAVSDVGEGMSEAISDVTDMGNAEDGKVSDSDGVIGNQESETGSSTENRTGMGWLALVITVVVVLIVVVLIILLIPKKKDR